MPLSVVSGRLPYYIPPDRKDRRGRTPLFDAVERGELDRVRAYLDAGHRAHVKDRDGMYLLTHAIHRQGQRDDEAMVRLLLDHTQRFDHDLGAQALAAAARYGQLALVQALAARGVPLDAEEINGDNALTAALGPGHDAVVDWLLDQGVPVENRTPGTIRSALLAAVQSLATAPEVDRARRLQRIDRLLNAGANPNRSGTGAFRDTTPALLAVKHDDLDLLNRMIASPCGLDVQQRVRGVQILGAVMMRVGQNTDNSRAMFDRVMALKPPLNDGPITEDDLALACALFDHLTGAEKAHRVRALLDAGADPMARTALGSCVLNLIVAHAFNGKPTTDALRDPALLARLAACPTLDVNARDLDGQTPLLHLVTAAGLFPQADLAACWLIEQGADVNAVSSDGWTLLSSLVGALPNTVLRSDAYARLLDVVLAQPLDWDAGRRSNQEDLCPGGYVAHLAVGRLPAPLLERLIKAGMPLDQTDLHGNTPLHRAVQLGQVDNGRLLLTAGAAVTVRNQVGQLPHEMVMPDERLPTLLNVPPARHLPARHLIRPDQGESFHTLRDEVLAVYEQGMLRKELAQPASALRARSRL